MNGKKRKFYKQICFVLSFFVLFSAMPVSINAEDSETQVTKTKETEHETVRVGWYEDSYHITDKNGDRSGYGYEFEQAVSAYTGWDYEYVTGDWPTLVEMLENGEIDLMSALSYTDERAETMLFSDQPMGEERYYLYVDLGNSDISAADLSTLNGKSIAMFENSIQTTQFCEWEDKYDVHTNHVFVNSIDEAKELLSTHEIQGVISTETSIWVDAGMSAIVVTGGSEIYYGINKKRLDLKEELDSAMRSMENDKPFYSDELYKQYIATQSTAVLSTEEKEWLEEHGEIRIGYLNDDSGFSTTDPKNGQLVGVINDYVDYAKECLGQTLKFDLVGFDTQEEQLRALQEEKIDTIFHVSQNPYYAEKNGLSLSNTVLAISVAAVTAQNAFDESAENTVAVTKDNEKFRWYISYNYPKWDVVEYDSEKEAEKAVQSGQADCMLVRSAQAMQYVNAKKLHSVFLTKAANISFAVGKGNTVLMSILNKTLKSMQTSKLSGAVSMYEDSLRKVTLADFIKDNLLVVTTVCIVLFALILSVILGLLKKARRAASRSQKLNKQLQESQHDLKTALMQAESANSAKTAFLNNMSHDIRTPMNAIIGFTSLAASHIDNKNAVKEYLRKIQTSSEHLLSLINDVLDMSRIESGKVKIDEKPLHLPDLLHDIRTIIRPSINSKQLDFLIDTVDVVDEDIIADKLRLTQILLNILSNAVKYNKNGGTVSLRVRQEKKAPKGCATYHFIIRDTGIGISKEFQKHIFENFSREETATVSGIQGTGLGLAITKKIVEMMGGTIALESEEGVGSEFDVCLTFKLDGEKKVYEVVESLQGLRVLVADDDTDTCISIAKMLSEIGMRSEWTVSGKEAVVRAKLATEIGDEFYAYIIDWLMPDMNGIETVRRIRRVIGDSSPIIILTAYDWSDVEEEAKEAGVTAFCEKPLFMSELRDILTKPMQVKKAEPELDIQSFRGRKILLVEDNELNQEIATEILKEAGFIIEVVNDGSVAVEKMKTSNPGQYDLILMDVQMPIMNGYEATKQIRAMKSEYCRQIPIVAMTANAFEDDRAMAAKAGMNGYLTKPIKIDEMLKTISSML